MKDLIAVFIYKIGIPPKNTTFIDGKTIMSGYGKLDGSIGVWQYNIPRKYLKRTDNH